MVADAGAEEDGVEEVAEVAEVAAVAAVAAAVPGRRCARDVERRSGVASSSMRAWRRAMPSRQASCASMASKRRRRISSKEADKNWETQI